MSNPNPERDERVDVPERIYLSRFHRHFIRHSCQFSDEWGHEGDIEYIRADLSGKQAVVSEELKSWRRVAEQLEQEKQNKPDFYETLNLKLSEASRRAATAMRDLCVAKVKAALADEQRKWSNGVATTDYELGQRAAFTYALSVIQSLTLDQVEQEK